MAGPYSKYGDKELPGYQIPGSQYAENADFHLGFSLGRWCPASGTETETGSYATINQLRPTSCCQTMWTICRP